MIGLAQPAVSGQIAYVAAPGLHLIGDLQSSEKSLLVDYNGFKDFIDDQILSLKLNKIGEVYHNFENGGFTAVVCLSESHLSIHTWPERDYLTFDVFLSNFLKDNNAATAHIFAQTVAFFQATVLSKHALAR